MPQSRVLSLGDQLEATITSKAPYRCQRGSLVAYD
jgi:hypothetical protein